MNIVMTGAMFFVERLIHLSLWIKKLYSLEDILGTYTCIIVFAFSWVGVPHFISPKHAPVSGSLLPSQYKEDITA